MGRGARFDATGRIYGIDNDQARIFKRRLLYQLDSIYSAPDETKIDLDYDTLCDRFVPTIVRVVVNNF